MGNRRRHHAAVCAALGDETRLSLVTTLSRGEPRSIAQLTGSSRMTRQAITKHLRVLESAALPDGRLQPFSGDTPLAVAYAHVNSDVPVVSSLVGGIPQGVDQLVRAATSRDPQQRLPR